MRDVEKWVACESGPPPPDYNNWEFDAYWEDGRIVGVNWPQEQGYVEVDQAWTDYFCVDCDKYGNPPTPTPAPPTECVKPELYLENYEGYCPNKSISAKAAWRVEVSRWIACEWSNHEKIKAPDDTDSVVGSWPENGEYPRYVRWPKTLNGSDQEEQSQWIFSNWSTWGFQEQDPSNIANEPTLKDRKYLSTMDHWIPTKEYDFRRIQTWAPCGERPEVFHNGEHWRANADVVPAGKEPGSSESMPDNLIPQNLSRCDTIGLSLIHI